MCLCLCNMCKRVISQSASASLCIDEVVSLCYYHKFGDLGLVYPNLTHTHSCLVSINFNTKNFMNGLVGCLQNIYKRVAPNQKYEKEEK